MIIKTVEVPRAREREGGSSSRALSGEGGLSRCPDSASRPIHAIALLAHGSGRSSITGSITVARLEEPLPNADVQTPGKMLLS